MTTAIQKTLCALAVLSTTSLSAFAESIDVKVIGTIDPAACTPTLAGGGTIDYGTIKPDTLAKDSYTVLPEKQANFTITCDAPAKIALTVTNNRVGSLADGSKDSVYGGNLPTAVRSQLSGNPVYGAGLGMAGSAQIGGYSMYIIPGTYTIDGGTSVDTIGRPGALNGWGKMSVGSVFSDTTQQISWKTTGTTVPVAFTTLSGQLGVQAYINKASALDLTKPISLDGSTTIELIYL